MNEKERNITYGNYSIKNKNYKIRLNKFNKCNNRKKELDIKSNNKEKMEKIENKKEIKRYLTVDKYSKNDNILKKRLAEKIAIEVKEKSIELTNCNKPKGLYNLGLSCYMNSLLQCFYYITELRDYFIKYKNHFLVNRPVCKALAEVMYGLKNDKKDYFEVSEFKKIMGNKNSLFQGFKAGDAKDLFINLIDALLTELHVENNKSYSSDNNIDLTNKLEALEPVKMKLTIILLIIYL